MNRRTVLSALAASALFVLVFPAFGDEGGKWEENTSSSAKKAGITTWKKEIEGSPVIAFKGTAVINAPILRVASVLADVGRQTEWMDRCKEAKVLRQVDTFEQIIWSHIGTPFPLTDRDFVTDSKMIFDDTNHVIKVRISSVTEQGAPVNDFVRGLITSSSFTLKSTADGKTQLTTEIHADPRGDVPKAIVNMVQADWPANTIAGVRKQAAKGDVQDADVIKNAIDGKGY